MAFYLRRAAGSGGQMWTIRRFSTSIDAAEVSKFSAAAANWWSPSSNTASALASFNAVRVPFIVTAASGVQHAPRKPNSPPLSGLNVLDVGCGGGILSEALVRLGATVTGIDASAECVGVASNHAAIDPRVAARVNYRQSTVEDLAAHGNKFDLVVASEVLEHVQDPRAFIASCCELVHDTGVVVVTTINRSQVAYATAILAAEHVLGLVSPGTHDWSKFVTPEELKQALSQQNFQITHSTGFMYAPWSRCWSRTSSLAVNYGIAAQKGVVITPVTTHNSQHTVPTPGPAGRVGPTVPTGEKPRHVDDDLNPSKQEDRDFNRDPTGERKDGGKKDKSDHKDKTDKPDKADRKDKSDNKSDKTDNKFDKADKADTKHQMPTGKATGGTTAGTQHTTNQQHQEPQHKKDKVTHPHDEQHRKSPHRDLHQHPH